MGQETFEARFEREAREYGIGGGNGGGDWFKVKEGSNRIRVISTPTLMISRYKHGICYDGAEYCKKENLAKDEKLQYKYLTWIIDRADAKVKLYSMPFSIAQSIVSFKANEEYAFLDFPMPYDLTIEVVGAGTKEVKYSLVPARKETPLTQEELAVLDKESTVEEVLQAMKDKARKQHGGSMDAEFERPEPDTDGATPMDYPDSSDAENIPF